MSTVSFKTGWFRLRRPSGPHRGIGLVGLVVVVFAAAARGQAGPEVNRRVVEVGVQPAPTNSASGFFFCVDPDWQAALRSDTATTVDAGTEIALEINGTVTSDTGSLSRTIVKLAVSPPSVVSPLMADTVMPAVSSSRLVTATSAGSMPS